MPSARRRTARCRFVDEDGDRCRRIATVDEQLCRSHAVVLELELEDNDPMGGLLDQVDRWFAGRTQNEVVHNLTDVLSAFLGPRLRQQEQEAAREFAALHARHRARQARQGHPNGRRRPPPPPPPPRPQVDPSRKRDLLARQILGFQPGDSLDKDTVKKRQRALAQVYHPDMPGGSTAQMQKVNSAADVLLANLA